jgi:hypothetical protein
MAALVASDEGDGQPLNVALVTGAMSQARNLFCKKGKDGGGEIVVLPAIAGEQHSALLKQYWDAMTSIRIEWPEGLSRRVAFLEPV